MSCTGSGTCSENTYGTAVPPPPAQFDLERFYACREKGGSHAACATMLPFTMGLLQDADPSLSSVRLPARCGFGQACGADEDRQDVYDSGHHYRQPAQFADRHWEAAAQGAMMPKLQLPGRQ